MKSEDTLDHDLPEDLEGIRGVIVAARYHADIVNRLIDGAQDAFAKLGGKSLYLVRVAGALEIPLALQSFFESDEVDFGVALGCVIRGETTHYDLVVAESLRGCMQVSLDFSLPVGHGILTVENRDQALERAGGSVGNKGKEALLAALELLNVLEEDPVDLMNC